MKKCCTCRVLIQKAATTGGGQYCSSCWGMRKPFEEACKEIGVEPQNEPFALFRAGVLAERASKTD